MARKLNKSLVAIGSAAIVTVYAAGFVRSGSPSIDAGAGSPSAAVAPATTRPGALTSTATAIAKAIAATPAPSILTGYQDGTFSGAGSNRFGEVDVAITIQGGAITDVRITRATTRYPVSRISRLPAQVIDRQSASVDLVTGATYSARAFKDAVTQALGQAAMGSTVSASRQG